MRTVLFIVFGVVIVSPMNADSLLDYTFGTLEKTWGNNRKASELFHKAYLDDRLSIPLARLEIRNKMATGDKNAAVAVYQELIEAYPNEFSIRLEYGDFLGRLGRGDSMAQKLQEDAYTDALTLRRGDYVILERLIRLARDRQNDDHARELLEKLVVDSPEAAIYYVNSTKSLYDSRDVDAAQRIDGCFEKMLVIHPDWAETARSASDHFRNTGRLSMAINILQKHVAAVPSSLDLKIRLGILMFSSDRDEEGVNILNEVLAVHPKKTLAHQVLAKHFRENGVLELGRYHSAELLKIRGGSPDEFIQLADELMPSGEYRAARLLLEKAVFDYEDNARLLMKLAIATSNDPETKASADRLFREAEALLGQIDETDPAFLLESARQLIESGESKKAEEKLKNAIRTFPKSAHIETASALRALAGIWLAEGRNKEAAQALINRAAALEKN